jgi:branched-chain amino acid transport system permease protein
MDYSEKNKSKKFKRLSVQKMINNRNWVAVAFLVVLPLILQDAFFTHLGIRALTYAIVVMGFSLFAGYTGQISLGHAAFFGFGAYMSGILTLQGVPFVFSVVLTTISVGLVGLLVGMSVLHTKGHYLALASIAVAMIMQVIVKNIEITGGPSGLIGVPKPSIFGMKLSSDLGYYYFVLFFLCMGFIVLQRIINSRTGDALRAIANNDLAAQSLGIPVFSYKVLSFTISTIFAGFAGALFGHYDGYADPQRLGIDLSVLFLIMAVIGGIGSLYGAIVGAFAITIVEHYTQQFGQYNVVVYGFILALVILYLPRGLVDIPNQIRQLIRQKKMKKPTAMVSQQQRT